MQSRTSGVLLPVFSLPGKYGIGTFSKKAYEFVDKVAKSGMTYWQVLPMGPTSYGDSPYQSPSTFAGNPYFIDLETLIEEGLLTKKECDRCDFGIDSNYIDYEKLYNARFKLLRIAFKRSDFRKQKDYSDFISENDFWINDYALFMAIKDSYGGKSYFLWDENVRNRDKKVLEALSLKFSEDIEFYIFLQYVFDKQWKALRRYANSLGVKIIGDIPIYVALDSADTFFNRELFLFDSKGNPTAVAGTPPDIFSKTGQLWGNPLYDWQYHKSTGYEWWIKRMRRCMELYDVVRIDHFRAFDAYYSIPFGEKNAVNGKWKKGPGFDLFKTFSKELGDIDVVAEDLGLLTDSVLKLVARCKYPGMKVLEFAFDPDKDNPYLPHNHVYNSYVYTGTHDNDTILGWYKTSSKKQKKFIDEFMNFSGAETDEEIVWSFIRMAYGSSSKVCIIPMWDFLALDSEARINVPSTLGGNWIFRMQDKAFDGKIIRKISTVARIYKR